MPVNLILFIFSIIREKRIHRSIEQSEQIKLRYKIKKQICDEQKKVKDKNQKTLLSRQNTGRKENNRRNPPPPHHQPFGVHIRGKTIFIRIHHVLKDCITNIHQWEDFLLVIGLAFGFSTGK